MQKTLESVVPLIMCKIYSPGKTFFWLPSFSSVALPSLATLPSSWGSPLHRDDNDDEPPSGSSKTRMWQVWVLAGSWSSLLCPLSWWVYALCPGEFVPFVLVSLCPLSWWVVHPDAQPVTIMLLTSRSWFLDWSCPPWTGAEDFAWLVSLPLLCSPPTWASWPWRWWLWWSWPWRWWPWWSWPWRWWPWGFQGSQQIHLVWFSYHFAFKVEEASKIAPFDRWNLGLDLIMMQYEISLDWFLMFSKAKGILLLLGGKFPQEKEKVWIVVSFFNKHCKDCECCPGLNVMIRFLNLSTVALGH